MNRPLLLLTNDDGITASGLGVLERELSTLGEVIVAAPAREQSAVGHGISLSRPLRVKTMGEGRYAVSGTPADSVLLALFRFCPRRPDLVISGINLGVNLGTDVFYSGTVAGALEGAIHGIPAMAVSQELPTARTHDGATAMPLLLERTARLATQLAASLLAHPLPPRVTLNVNAPAAMTDRFCWTRQGRRAYREQVEERLDLRGVPYYWLGGPPLPGQSEPGTDAHAVEHGWISLTPLGLDLTVALASCYHGEVEGFVEHTAAP
jgi:5'-nucleotidase